jgi:hypothetical protein
MGQPGGGGRLGVGEEDVEVAGAVHAFDPDEFDVAGGGGTGDEGVRAGRVQPGERVGQVGGHLIGADHHQVEVGHQGERGGPDRGRGRG